MMLLKDEMIKLNDSQSPNNVPLSSQFTIFQLREAVKEYMLSLNLKAVLS